MDPASFLPINAVTEIAQDSTPAVSSGTQNWKPMAKSRGAKRGRKKKRIAVHIKEAQGKRTANALSLDDGKATQLLTIPAVGDRLRPSKRPRDSGSSNDKDTTQDKERTGASSYLSAWLSARKAQQAAQEGDNTVVTDVWKFNKKTQAWLLRNMFAEKEVSEQSFNIMCLYLEGLKGSARQRVLAEAQQKIEKHGPDEGGEQSAAVHLVGPNSTEPTRKRVRFEGESSDSESIDTTKALETGSSNSEGESSDAEGTGVANAIPTGKMRKKVRSASERQAKIEDKARAATVAYERALKVAEVVS